MEWLYNLDIAGLKEDFRLLDDFIDLITDLTLTIGVQFINKIDFLSLSGLSLNL